MLAIVALSILIRAAAFVQLQRTELVDLPGWTETDMHYYDAWGRAIAGGDWLSRSVGVPMHAWHAQVADAYLAAHPAERVTLECDAAHNRVSAEALLWSRWTGHAFYEDPLYAYLVGLTYRLFGPDPRVVLAWQLGLGVLTNVLIYIVAARCFGPLAGAIAGGLAVLASPLLFYELLLLRDSTVVFATAAIAWIAMVAIDRDRWPWHAALGGALGLAVLLKATFLLVALAIAIGFAVAYRRRLPALRVPAVASVVAFGLMLTPAIARNAAVGAPPFSLATGGAATFVASNVASYPAEGGLQIDAPAVADVLAASNGRLLPAVAATWRRNSRGTTLGIAWHKIENTWNWYEIPNNADFYYARSRVAILRWLPVTFFLVSPLALVGFAFTARRWRTLWPLVLIVAASIVPLVAFAVMGRLRAPLLALTVPMAAITIERLARSTWRVRAALLAAVVAVACFTGRTRAADLPLLRGPYVLEPYYARYQPEATRALAAGRPDAAASALLAYFSLEPALPMAPGGGPLPAAADRATALTLARLHADCWRLLARGGRTDDARRQAARAADLFHAAGAPAEADLVLGEDRLEADQVDEAIALLRDATRMDPTSSDAHASLAQALARAGRAPDAIAEYQMAIARRPDVANLHTDLAVLLAQGGRLAEALPQFEEAVRLEPGAVETRLNLATVLGQLGRTADEVAELQAALSIDPANAAAKRLLDEAQRSGRAR